MKKLCTLLVLLTICLQGYSQRGPIAYGATISDEFGFIRYVKFDVNNPGALETIGRVDPADEGLYIKKLRCGAFCDGVYYGYLTNVYTYIEQPESFVKVNFTTGNAEIIKSLNPADPNWPIIYEMTYDNTNDICWALGRNQTSFTSDIYEIDLNDGSYEKKGELGFYAWALAADYEGNLYAIKGIVDASGNNYIGSSLVRLNADFSIAESFDLKPDGADFIPNYTHTMDFAHDTNLLYWFGTNNEGWQYEFQINPKNRSIEKIGSMGYNTLSAIGIAFGGADNRDAAGCVTELAGIPDANDALKATIKWKNPTINWRGDQLTELRYVTVSRGSVENVLATLDAENKMGEQMSWIDEQAPAGISTYYIIPYRKAGERGLVDSVQVMVGPDVPGQVANLSVAAEGANARITWSKPVASATGKNYDETTLTYTVIRMPEQKTIAENITQTSIVDNTLSYYSQLYYVVKAMNSTGEGPETVSVKINAGKPFIPTFSTNFENNERAAIWSADDQNYDGETFHYAGGTSLDLQYFSVFMNSSTATDDYLFSPPIYLESGHDYLITGEVLLGRPEDSHNFSLTIGKSPAAASQSVLKQYERQKGTRYNEAVAYSVKKTVDEDGIYYAGIHCYSPQSFYGSYFGVNSFSIEEMFKNDLAAIEITGPVQLSAGTQSVMNVRVKNKGSLLQSSYKVQVIDADDQHVLGETSDIPALNSLEDAVVEVAITPEGEGELRLVGKVVLNGDEQTSNDQTSEVVYKVQPAGTVMWNTVCTGGNQQVSTTEPMNFYHSNSTNEMIYRADEIGGTTNGKIHGITFEYSSNGIYSKTEDVNIDIYMGNTDKTSYPENAELNSWTHTQDLQKVFSGTTRVEIGEKQLMTFMFATPFEYDYTKNLLVQIWKDGITSEAWPALLQLYDVDAGVCRLLRYQGSNPFSFSQSFLSLQKIPVAYLAIDYGTSDGIQTIEIKDKHISYDAATRNICLHGLSARQVAVYDMAGKVQLVANATGSADERIPVNLQKGLYIIKVTDQQGAVTAKTINIAL